MTKPLETMTPKQAAKLLTEYNKWRRGDDTKFWTDVCDTKKISMAIDLAVKALSASVKK